MGDAFQFVRYTLPLLERGEKVRFAVASSQMSLFRNHLAWPLTEVVDRDRISPDREGPHIPLMSLIALLDATTISDSNLEQNAVRNLTSLVHGGNLQKTTSAIFSTSQIGYIFSALKEQGNSRLVSHPTVVTLNNQEAEISVGEQFPIPNYQYNEERGTFEVSGFEYKDIGVILKVKPSVNNEGLITMKVPP